MANLQSTKIFGTLEVVAKTESNNSISGALKVAGGVGIGKNLNVGGSIDIGGNINASGKSLTVGTINGLTITPAPGKTLDLSEGSLTVGTLTKDHVLIVGGVNNVVASEAQLSVSRGGTGYGKAFSKGQILIGKEDGSLNRSTISGTASRVIVSNGDGTITLSTPQDIHTGATPQFARIGVGVASDSSANLKLSAGTILSNVSDGATAKGFTLKTVNELKNESAKLLSISNKDSEKFSVKQDGSTSISGDLYIGGDFTVTGAVYFEHAETLQITDKNIEIGFTSNPSNDTADGGGITLLGGVGHDKTIIWKKEDEGSWLSSENWNLGSGKEYRIGGTSVLSSATLGGGVKNSSLTSVGKLKTLTVVPDSPTDTRDRIIISPSDKGTNSRSITIKTPSNALSNNRIFTLPDLTNSEFVMSEGKQTINGEKTFTNLKGNIDGNATSANKVNKSFALKIKSGSTEGSSLYTFDGGDAKTLDIQQSTNIILTPTSGILKISAIDTTYNEGTGISLDPFTNTFSIDSTVVTLDGEQTLTNKKLGSLTNKGFVIITEIDGTLGVDTNIYSKDDHIHGNISNDGKIGTTGNQLLITSNASGEKGKVKTLTTGSNGKVLKVVSGAPTWSDDYQTPLTASTYEEGVAVLDGTIVRKIKAGNNIVINQSNHHDEYFGDVGGDNPGDDPSEYFDGITIHTKTISLGNGLSKNEYTDKTYITLDKATKKYLGGVKIGDGISVNNDGVISVDESGIKTEKVTMGKFQWVFNSNDDSLELFFNQS